MKPKTIADVQVLLSEDPEVDQKWMNSLNFHLVNNEQICRIRPRARLPSSIWQSLNRRIKELGGAWVFGAWEVPLSNGSVG